MKLKRILKAFGPNGALRLRFSQYGEDTIIRKVAKKKNGFYIDVGAHHPFRQSNTAYLWCLGWNGINVDANPESVKLFEKMRRDDVTIWGAVISSKRAQDQDFIEFYQANSHDLCATASPELASERNATEVLRVPCLSLRSIIEDHAQKDGREIDFMNIDIEGLDDEAVEDIAEWPMLPRMIAIETYADTIPDVIESETYKRFAAVGYKYKYQIGVTAVYMLA